MTALARRARLRRLLTASAVTAALLAPVLVGAAAGVAAPVVGTAVTYRPPVDGQLLRGFDPPPRPWLSGHRGVDLSTGPGATVRAPAAGTVAFAGQVASRGVVTVLHDDGRRSSLEPVHATVLVGARVGPGDPVGVVVGAAHGDVPGALHWGVREGDAYVDPWALLPGRGPVVLLPPA